MFNQAKLAGRIISPGIAYKTFLQLRPHRIVDMLRPWLYRQWTDKTFLAVFWQQRWQDRFVCAYYLAKERVKSHYGMVRQAQALGASDTFADCESILLAAYCQNKITWQNILPL